MYNHLTISIFIIFFIPASAFTWDNPCYRKAVHFKFVPHDKEFTITLEAERVVSADDASFTYNTGREFIIITADSFSSQRFLKDVQAGRCSAHERVTLVPERESPFNNKFNAERSR
ncbi:MAG: hypothetical protein HZA16_12205 [Nitrospirae bacterium]|nr:hypothetical protein [Nitrospirota bacterium]